MDLSRHMNKIIEIDAEQRVARVQPGVVQEQLNLAGARHGLVFGPDTSTKNRATLGGMIGNNSAGSHSVRYGMTIDHVLALDVVLSDASQATFGPADQPDEPVEPRGRVDTRRERSAGELPAPAPTPPARPSPPASRGSGGNPAVTGWTAWPRSTGLDLAQLVVGSEGTLVTVVDRRHRPAGSRAAGTASSPSGTSPPCRRPSRPPRPRWPASPPPSSCSTAPSSTGPPDDRIRLAESICTATPRPSCS